LEANGALSVSFVDNHDTDHSTGALFSPEPTQDAGLRLHPHPHWLPRVFYRDYYEYGSGA
jgi:alpha-amylase